MLHDSVSHFELLRELAALVQLLKEGVNPRYEGLHTQIMVHRTLLSSCLAELGVKTSKHNDHHTEVGDQGKRHAALFIARREGALLLTLDNQICYFSSS